MSDYTDSPPTEPGWYWLQLRPANHERVCRFTGDMWLLGGKLRTSNEIVLDFQFGPRVPTPEELAELKRENHELRKMCRRLEQEVSDLSELSDCKETLREVGMAFGCDHVETADERRQLVNCAEQQFSAMDDLRRDAERYQECERLASVQSYYPVSSTKWWQIKSSEAFKGSTFADAVDDAIKNRKGE